MEEIDEAPRAAPVDLSGLTDSARQARFNGNFGEIFCRRPLVSKKTLYWKTT